MGGTRVFAYKFLRLDATVAYLALSVYTASKAGWAREHVSLAVAAVSTLVEVQVCAPDEHVVRST